MPTVTIEQVRVGFDGHYRVGFWTPVEATVRCEATTGVTGQLVLSTVDGDNIRTETPSTEVSLAAGEETRLLSYVKFGGAEADLTVAFVSDGRELTRRQVTPGGGNNRAVCHKPFRSTQGLMVTLGRSIGVEDALKRQGSARDDRIELVALSDARQLPDAWYGYEGVDLLVIGPESPGIADFIADDRRLAALEEWIAEGGRLLLAPGDDAAKHFADGQPLARLLPGRLGPMTTLTRVEALESYGGEPLPYTALAGGRANLLAARLLDVQGRMKLREGELALVASAARGFGRISFVAIDLSGPPFVDWNGRRRFVRRLLGLASGAESDDGEEESAGPAAHLGLVDLAGQLRGALDQFEGVELSPFSTVAMLAVLYIALIGPVDYFLLRWLGRRMELTWLTFSLMIVLFCGGTWWLTHRLKGDRLLVNQAELVDVDLASGRVRGTTWFNVFSPATAHYDLSVVPRPAGAVSRVAGNGGPQVLLSWQGLPGAALGGMEQAMAGPATVARAYRLADDRTRLVDVPVPVWSTKSFIARWRATVGSPLDVDLHDAGDDEAEGTITNRLDVPLSSCLLVARHWAWNLPDLAPGQTARIERGEQRDLQSLLKGFKLIREGDRDSLIQVATPYDQSSFDIPSILKQMMFYDAAKGRKYTGLLNRYQSFVDLSSHLELGQAVLWAAVPQPASEVREGGRPLSPGEQAAQDDRRWTYYRFLIPLQPPATAGKKSSR